MIDLYDEIKKYKIIELDTDKQNTLSENKRKSVELYNKAVNDISAKNEDMAVIALKKAVELNKKFYHAINLLGLCYFHKDEYGEAIKVFKTVTSANQATLWAVKYLAELNVSDYTHEMGIVIRKKVDDMTMDFNKIDTGKSVNKEQSFWTKISEAVNIGKSSKSNSRRIVFGIAMGIAVVFLLSLPYYFKVDRVQRENKVVMNSSVKNEDKDYNRLSAENEKIKGELEYYKEVEKLNKAEKLFKDRSYNSAINLLIKIDSKILKGEKSRFESVYASTIKALAETFSIDGKNLYNVAKYDESIKKFNDVVKYNAKWNSIDEVYYFLGLDYYAKKDNKKATENFQKVVDNYPKSKYFNLSKNYLSRIK